MTTTNQGMRHMQSKRVPCVLMRGGTSRGPYFLASDLPQSVDERDAFLLSVMGSGHDLQVDGIGGGNPLTSKVAIVGPGSVDGADVDYLFAQVKVREQAVDTSPNCGNMLSGVGPFAIEAGLVPAVEGTTVVRIHNVNTGNLIEARVSTPDGQVTYDGEARIDGVPGQAAAVELAFLDAAGAKTGKLLPTGATMERIVGVDVTCIDCSTPMVLIRATDMGKSGAETPGELDSDHEFMQRLEAIRIEAGRRMGLGDVASLVIPKPVLLSQRGQGGTINARYFMPQACHKALAITGAVGIATACAKPGTLAHDIADAARLPTTVAIEHPSGRLEVRIEERAGSLEPVAHVVRTVRKIFEGFVHARVVTRSLCSSATLEQQS